MDFNHQSAPMTLPTHLATATYGILDNNHLLAVALQATITLYHKKAPTPQAILAWGQKKSSQQAKALAHSLNLPVITAEDGFLRSLDSGTGSKFGASFVVDDVGIYFDLTAPNRLQALIAQTVLSWNVHKEQKSKDCIQTILSNHLSKYNSTTHAPNLSHLAGNDKPHVIIIDQVVGDASLAGAGAVFEDVEAMVDSARHAYPNANLWIKTHPAGTGHFDFGQTFGEGVFYLSTPCNPIKLLAQAQAVYTVSSHMGFEALMLGKTVHCFGVNWYTGFGLTDDTYVQNQPLYAQVKAHHQALGMRPPTVHQLFYASYVVYSCYANPATHQACDIEEVMEYLILNQKWQDKLSGDLLAYEFSRWKLGFVRGFVGFSKVNLKMVSKKLRLLFSDRLYQKRSNRRDQKLLPPLTANPNQSYLTWGQKSKQHLQQKLAVLGKANPNIWCMEDGFIRSNGLGATLLEPLSVVLDDLGIYFDATAPSRLERILIDIHLNKKELERASNLQQLLLTQRVSKYNVGIKNHQFFQKLNAIKHTKPHQKVHLVVGQVEDDASVQCCASLIKTNSDLLSKVRADHPHDIIIYKPHPDTEAGLRKGKINPKTLQQADLLACDLPMPDCLECVDVVHTISSLTGFEALIRQIDVVCYGVPFYAGFGLTQDVVEADNLPKQQALARRHRSTPLTVEELIFGTLIEYPLYRLPMGHGLTTPEKVINHLYQQSPQIPPFKKRLIRQTKTKVMRLRHWVGQL